MRNVREILIKSHIFLLELSRQLTKPKTDLNYKICHFNQQFQPLSPNHEEVLSLYHLQMLHKTKCRKPRCNEKRNAFPIMDCLQIIPPWKACLGVAEKMFLRVSIKVAQAARWICIKLYSGKTQNLPHPPSKPEKKCCKAQACRVANWQFPTQSKLSNQQFLPFFARIYIL